MRAGLLIERILLSRHRAYISSPINKPRKKPRQRTREKGRDRRSIISRYVFSHNKRITGGYVSINSATTFNKPYASLSPLSFYRSRFQSGSSKICLHSLPFQIKLIIGKKQQASTTANTTQLVCNPYLHAKGMA